MLREDFVNTCLLLIVVRFAATAAQNKGSTDDAGDESGFRTTGSTDDAGDESGFRTTGSTYDAGDESGFRTAEVTGVTEKPSDGFEGSGEGLCHGGSCTATCRADDDPHMLTFDGRFYEMQQEGVFYLYKHAGADIWVQGAFQSCGYNGAFCSCGVAVRYYDETFVVDKCVKPGGDRANVVAKLGTDASMVIRVYFAGFEVDLKSGLKVYIGSYEQSIGTISLLTTTSDIDQVQGLCGYYSGYVGDDYTWRSGEVTDISQTYPYDFADSWRVPLEENLFNGTNLDGFAPCVRVSSATFVPKGVTDACFLNITPSTIVESFRNDHGGGKRAKRQASTQGFPDGEWPAPWNYSAAVQFCNAYLSGRSVVSDCDRAVPGGVAVNQYAENCARDIFLTGGTSFASVALTSVLTNCLQQLQTFNLTSPSIVANLCPFDCSNMGYCSSGACVCATGWGGADCSTNLSLPPAVTRTVPNSDCPPAGGKSLCYSADVFGGVFFESTLLSVQGQIYPAGDPSKAKSIRVVVTFISSGHIRIRVRIPTCPGHTGTFVLVIRISNDGVIYSEQVTVVVTASKR